MDERLVLIDGHALAYRAFFALPLEAFSTKGGEPTNATYGFTRTLLDLILSDNPPRYLALCFDLGKTFRDELFEEYKGTREKMPDELRLQIRRIREVGQALNIPVIEKDGFEADDLLGTIARLAKGWGVPVHIITGDQDILQLVDDNTMVELPPTRQQRSPRLFDKDAVMAKLGVRPDQVVDYKALVGDKSDNIPGVQGIGPKTAQKLLAEYDTFEGIYANIGQLKGAVKSRLENDRDNAILSQTLARIVTDVPLALELDACETHDFDPGPVLDLFRELEFRTFSSRLSADESSAESPLAAIPTVTTVVRDKTALRSLVDLLEQADEISFDVETTSLDTLEAELVGICLAVEAGKAFYIPVGHVKGSVQSDAGQMGLFAGKKLLEDGQLPLEEVLDALAPVLTDPAIRKIAHHAKYDYAVLVNHGLKVQPIGFDTLIAEWLTDPASKHLGLKDLAFHRLGVQMQPQRPYWQGNESKAVFRGSYRRSSPVWSGRRRHDTEIGQRAEA